MTIRPTAATLMLLALLFGLACGDKNNGSNPDVAAMVQQERASLQSSFTVVSDQVQRVTFHTPKDQLADLRTKAIELRDRLSKLPERTAMENERLAAAEQEVVRVESAITLQEARDELDQLLKDANLTPKQAKLPLDQKRVLLREQWPKFREAEDKVIRSERSYTDAGNNLAAAIKRIKLAEELAEG